MRIPIFTPVSGRPIVDPEKKFNVVVYGIAESPKGTPRLERVKQDLSSVVLVLSELSSSVQAHAIKDCYRLGKFNPQRLKPRPILVRLIRIADVHSILSNRGSLSSPIYIKPDMTKEKRHRESVLLKERWNLIQSGVPKNVIRIQGSRLYGRNALHGQLKNSMSTASIVSSHDPCSNEHSQSPASQPVYHACIIYICYSPRCV